MYKSLTLPLLITLLFHGVILAILLVDMPESRPMVKRAATKYIHAELVTLDKVKVNKTTQTKPVEKKAPKVEPKPDNSKAEKAAVAKKAELEQQRKQQAAKQEQQKQKQKQEQVAQKKREDQLRQEEQQRLQQQEMIEAMEKEQQQALAMNDMEMANSYIALITEAIQNNWNRPPSARNSMEAELVLQLVPTGEVVSVKISHSSGNAAFDRSAETAVLKAERFPELQKLPARVFEQHFRRLTLKFKPEDLRL
ncbi:MAG: energy transducer TonB [Spongiibacteraceae bacterium]